MAFVVTRYQDGIRSAKNTCDQVPELDGMCNLEDTVKKLVSTVGRRQCSRRCISYSTRCMHANR
jgi:hypothetical protein